MAELSEQSQTGADLNPTRQEWLEIVQSSLMEFRRHGGGWRVKVLSPARVAVVFDEVGVVDGQLVVIEPPKS